MSVANRNMIFTLGCRHPMPCFEIQIFFSNSNFCQFVIHSRGATAFVSSFNVSASTFQMGTQTASKYTFSKSKSKWNIFLKESHCIYRASLILKSARKICCDVMINVSCYSRELLKDHYDSTNPKFSERFQVQLKTN